MNERQGGAASQEAGSPHAGSGPALSGRQLLADVSFRNLWLAGNLSLLGSQISRIGLILYLFQTSDSVPAIAFLVLLETLPGILVAPWAGAAVDRFSKRGVMITADVVRLVMLGVLLLWPTTALIYVTAAVHSAATAFFQPARTAAVPLVVRPRDLAGANSMEHSSANLVMILGPVVGAELLLQLGLTATLVVDMLTYLLSALLLLPVRVRRVAEPRAEAGSGAPVLASAASEARAGWRYVVRHLLVLQMILLFFVSLLCTGLWTPLAPFFIRDVLGGGERILGLQIAVTGLGAVLGALVAPRLMARFGQGVVLVVGLVAEGCAMTLYSQTPSALASLAVMLVWGVAVSVIVVPFYSILQAAVEERFLGRVFSLVKQSENCALVVAMGLAMLLQDRLSTQLIFLLGGVFYLGLTAVLSLTRGGRGLLATR